MPKKPAYMKKFDPALFEWDPSASEVSDDELFETLEIMGTQPEWLRDPEERKAYEAFLLKRKRDRE